MMQNYSKIQSVVQEIHHLALREHLCVVREEARRFDYRCDRWIMFGITNALRSCVDGCYPDAHGLCIYARALLNYLVLWNDRTESFSYLAPISLHLSWWSAHGRAQG
ncbi:uncharacterized protein CIMG_13405 [Coccidioides immitis RS]|uniref:Uncharacterized protein n=1 Tax=Coccidioides immitis (strain RS) TaxID=246410 RepID=A0A0D8JVU9_COCIM|nr:uncharacterized protein CIMG_13405 [Coccidioides immitis RS]KJF61071.1 hypothetical protein CIMG_13405 [Coccidioides immitis RS]